MVTSESSAIADSADEQHIPPEPRAARVGEFRVIRRGPVNVSVRQQEAQSQSRVDVTLIVLFA